MQVQTTTSRSTTRAPMTRRREDVDDEVSQEDLIQEIQELLTVTPTKKDKELSDDHESTTEGSVSLSEDPWLVAADPDVSPEDKRVAFWELCYGNIVIPKASQSLSAQRPLPRRSCLRRQASTKKSLKFANASAVTFQSDAPVEEFMSISNSSIKLDEASFRLDFSDSGTSLGLNSSIHSEGSNGTEASLQLGDIQHASGTTGKGFSDASCFTGSWNDSFGSFGFEED